MATVQDGLIVVGDQTTGYTERQIYVQWDITSDLISERNVTLLKPFYLVSSTRNVTFVRVQYLYMTRWVHVEYEPIPVTERQIYVEYSLCQSSERTIYYYPDTRERLVFVEGLLTATPLVLKYPKYYNWTYVPQILTPEFIIWAYYPLNENDITFKVVGSSGTSIALNSGVHSSKFKIEKIADLQYKITILIDHTFENGETVNCYLTAYDVKGNELKQGLW